MKDFIISQLSYCLITRMFCSRELNSTINSLRLRDLQIVYRDNLSTFEDLLRKNGSVSTQLSLAIEIYNVVNRSAPNFMFDIFIHNTNIKCENVSASTRSHFQFYNPANPSTSSYGRVTDWKR